MAIHNRHDFHALSALRSSDFRPAALGHDERCVDEAFFFVQCASKRRDYSWPDGKRLAFYVASRSRLLQVAARARSLL
jgi:hypothetical protein